MRSLHILVCLLTLASIGRSLQADDESSVASFFHEQIEPILVGHCLECHGVAEKGELDLRTRPGALAGGESGTAIEPGDAEQSLLFQYVSTHEMPPEEPLTDNQISAIQDWINGGAYYPQQPIDPFAITTDRRAGYNWWSLVPLAKVDSPETPEIPVAWQQSPMDRFVYAELAENGLQPSPPADPKTLIRRATYDLIGLPPTPDEVDAFLEACRTETGQADQVGERVYGKLIDRLLRSKHYGEQWGRHWLDVVRFGESNGYEQNLVYENAWPFRDYVIQSLNDDKPFDRFVLEHIAGDVLGPDDPKVAVATAFLVCGPYDNVGNQNPAAAAQTRADTIDEMIRATSEAFLGLTVGCCRCHDHKFDPIAQQDYYGMYATFAGVRHGDRAIGGQTELSEVIGGQTELSGDAETAPKWWIGNFEQIDGPFHIFLGGSPQRCGSEVVPSSMNTLTRSTRGYHLAANSPENVRRFALASWIVAADNPLTPRVLANRLWHYHFGTGIVSTPSDFGFLGGRPSHPELLDWLAMQLREDGWRLKPMHKRIMLSQSYRQASQFRVEAANLDGDSRLLWRYPPRRLSGEEIRDSILAISGKLDMQMGGPGFRLFKYVRDNVATYYPLDKHGAETFRRAVYHHTARATQIDLISEFDKPDCAYSAPRRSTTTTPLQALTLMNHSFAIDMAEAFAERIAADADTDDLSALVTQAFQLAFSRPPRAKEKTGAMELIEKQGSRAFCRALINASEFIYLD